MNVISTTKNSIKQALKEVNKRLPWVSTLARALTNFPASVRNAEHVPAGHFYSAIPDQSEVLRHWDDIKRDSTATLTETIDFHEARQMALLEQFAPLYAELPFPEQPRDGFRYYFENEFYSYSDAICLYSMLRHFTPKRVVEVGSGFSSAVMLDTNERFLNGKTHLTFIDPNPERLHSLLRASDAATTSIHVATVQSVDVSVFQALEAGDILFVDNSHVSKVGSDVNYIFFNVLPLLKKGVLIHLHDIFDGFEYPKSWIEQGCAYNEMYLLRAFLSFNPHFSVRLFNTFMENRREAWFAEKMPLCLRNRGGSIWIEKNT
jgi:predicted O-methyltransferase YrrM